MSAPALTSRPRHWEISSLERFIVSRDDDIYEAFPDVSLTPSGRLVCVFAECTHHRDRGYTRVMCDHLR